MVEKFFKKTTAREKREDNRTALSPLFLFQFPLRRPTPSAFYAESDRLALCGTGIAGEGVAAGSKRGQRSMKRRGVFHSVSIADCILQLLRKTGEGDSAQMLLLIPARPNLF